MNATEPASEESNMVFHGKPMAAKILTGLRLRYAVGIVLERSVLKLDSRANVERIES